MLFLLKLYSTSIILSFTIIDFNKLRFKFLQHLELYNYDIFRVCKIILLNNPNKIHGGSSAPSCIPVITPLSVTRSSSCFLPQSSHIIDIWNMLIIIFMPKFKLLPLNYTFNIFSHPLFKITCITSLSRICRTLLLFYVIRYSMA